MINGLVAIVGRPNVGKSTLFNRITRSNSAIVDDQPGVTRDRLYGTVYFDKEKTEATMVIDTGGFETDDFNFQPFSENLVWQQTEAAIEEADLVLFVLDGKHGIHHHDRELALYLERTGKAVIYVVNKVDGQEKQQEALWDFYGLGVDELFPVSAAHNKGVKELINMVHDNIRHLKPSDAWDEKDVTKVALIGKPNVGKSSMMNRLVGEERAVVSDIAGTTRDSLDTKLVYNQHNYIFVDTAGVRRKTKIHEKLESQSVVRSLRAIERADITLLVIDALEGITDQDARLANLVISRYKPLMIVVNKWDLVPEKEANTAKMYADNIRKIYLRDMKFIPVAFVSCLTNQRVHKLLDQIEGLSEVFNKRVSTSVLNDALQTVVQKHTPQLIRNYSKRVKFFYATQVRTAPPTFVIKCNVEDEIQESYKRYIANKFREILGFEEIPLRIFYRGKTKKEVYLKKLHEPGYSRHEKGDENIKGLS